MNHRVYVFVFAVLSVMFAGCTSTSDGGNGAEQSEKIDKAVFDRQIAEELLGEQAELGMRDYAELQARTSATVEGKFDEERYEELLEEKRKTIPNLRIEYNIVDSDYYQTEGEWHARVLAEKRFIVDGTRLSREGWEKVKNGYARREDQVGTVVDDEAQMIIMGSLENHKAVRRDGKWIINPTRMVE